MVPRGCRRRSVGDPGLKIRNPAKDHQAGVREPAAHPGGPPHGRSRVMHHGQPETASV
jgi:hypothetical protein